MRVGEIPVPVEHPEHECEAPVLVPVAALLDTYEALAYGHLAYPKLARARRVDAELNAALITFRGRYAYAVRAFFRWLPREQHRRRA